MRDPSPALIPVAKGPSTPAQEDAEAVSGDASYLDILRHVHDELEPRIYLEIGVRHGRSIALARCRAIGVDPDPKITVDLGPDVSIINKSSDAFFDEDAASYLKGPPDFVFIDGMHLFEFVLRDFMESERHAQESSVIIFDDVFPNNPVQAERTRRSTVWTGDVWKLLPCLRRYRPELVLVPINARPTGMLLVAGLKPSDRRLRDHYNSIVREFVNEITVPSSILRRDGALRPDDPRLEALLMLLRAGRTWGAAIADQLSAWRATAKL
jgi:hypothetical protein